MIYGLEGLGFGGAGGLSHDLGSVQKVGSLKGGPSYKSAVLFVGELRRDPTLENYPSTVSDVLLLELTRPG